MRVVHIVPGVDDVANGMAVVAHLLAKEQGDAEVVDLKESQRALRLSASALNTSAEVWVHGMWLPKEWLACWCALRAGKRLVRMTHGSLSSLYLKHQSPFKKWIVGPIERWCLRRCDRIVATCEAEAEWIRAYDPRVKSIEVTDIKRFFNLSRVERVETCREGRDVELHVLYLGRKHPLKGVEFLEKAVAKLNSNPVNPVNPVQNSSARSTRSTRLKIVSNAFGEELEKVWDWCDVLVLPTLSDNFGLVIAEALERGKRVITTDGAPAWGESLELGVGSGGVEELRVESGGVGSEIWSGYGGRLIYLKGYRDGTDETRVELLKRAIERICK